MCVLTDAYKRAMFIFPFDDSLVIACLRVAMAVTDDYSINSIKPF